MHNIKSIYKILYSCTGIFISKVKSSVFSPVCSHHCLESSQETEAPRRCWLNYRSNLCTAGPAERQEVGIISGVHLSACVYVQCFVWKLLNVYAFPLPSACLWLLYTFSTLPFSGRIIDWEWLSCCLTSCRAAEFWHWASALLIDIVLRVSEETARCMLFTGVKGRGQTFGSVVNKGKGNH